MNLWIKAVFFLFVIVGGLDAKIKDLKTAYATMDKEKKPLLVYFKSGSDKNDPFSNEPFLSKIEGHLVFAEIDLASLPKEEKAKIKDKYHLQDLPRLVLMDEKGSELSRYGIYDEKPENIGKELLKIIDKSSSLTIALKNLKDISGFPLQVEELYQTALELKRDVDAEKILNFGIEQNFLFFLIEKYRLLTEKGDVENRESFRKRIEENDPKNEREGFYSLALIDFQSLAAIKSPDAIKPLEDYVARFGETDHKNRWRLEMMIAQYYVNFDDWNKSLHHAETAFQEAPLDVKKEIARCCSYIKNQLNTEATAR